MKKYRGFRVPDSFTPLAKHPSESKERGYQAVVNAARRFVVASKIDVTVYGSEYIPERGGALIAGNHTSYYDFVFAGAGPHIRGRRLVRFMAKQSVFTVPVLGPALKRMGHVPVNRAHGAASVDDAVRALKDGSLVAIFPEATISRSFELANFKTGAARIAHAADVPLIPWVAWGGQRIWTKDLPKQLRGVPVIVRYGEPVELTGDAVADTERLKAKMQELLNVSRKEYSDLHGAGEGEPWMPAALGGTAPTLEEAEELHREERAARAAKKAAKGRKEGRR